MPTKHAVVEGECLADVAYAHGFFADTVWQHADNAALREARPNRNILMPGDVVTIPDKADRSWSGPTGKLHRFRRRGIPHVFRLQVLLDEQPRKSQPFTLTITGPDFEKVVQGKTDEDGVLRALVPPRAKSGVLEIGEDADKETIDVLFGSLDPVDELAGVQKRLANFGFACPVDGEPGPATEDALRAFQERFGLPITGEADAATRTKLTELHESTRAMPDAPSRS